MSVGKDGNIEVVTSKAELGVMKRRMRPSVGQFNMENMVEAKYQGCIIEATHAHSIAPACNYGVFNTKVLERSLKRELCLFEVTGARKSLLDSKC